jgi:acyl-CoA synthetase (AMP-forming)/AMP-acid ligase II
LLLDAVATHARERPDAVAIRFLERGEDVTSEATYADLVTQAEAVASVLLDRGCAGRPVILALRPGIGFVATLLGCLRAGVIAVPVPFPPAGEGRQRLVTVLNELRGAAAVTDDAAAIGALSDESRLILSLTAMPRRNTTDLPAMPAADAPAVIQYSSGSTRAPRGIVLSHGNIASNLAMVREVFGTDTGTVGVNWLPPHHDMGLFGAILQPLYAGGLGVLMPPFAFIQKPVRWLRAIDRHRGDIGGGPNFGYELCVRRVRPQDAPGLDLSSWTIAFCGAEPIRAASLQGFADHFAPARFDPRAILPCYGLAEATLLATSARPGTGLRQVPVASRPTHGPRPRVSCGEPPMGCHVSIHGPETGVALPLGAAGEICVAGPHVAVGEWCAETGRITALSAALPDNGRRLLRTGDIGALTAAGLVVIDRMKDILFLHGRNLHAADIEQAAIAATGQALMAVAAFAAGEPDQEILVLLGEIATADRQGRDLARLSRDIAAAVGQECGVVPRTGFLPHGALPRTTSGKIRRQAARRAYAAGTLHLLATVEA